jgi:capsular exopolysaccharide synthesis family protein
MLAVVAEAEDTGHRVLKTAVMTAFAEDYRILRTALNYSWSERGPRVVLVTSSVPGEGKTLTALNLAMTLARMDGKVLLLDADMRKPEAHELLAVPRAPGLSDVLVGEVEIGKALHTVTENGLQLLPAGNEAPSPADLMSTHVMEAFLDGLRARYNWVVVDSPPVGAVAEPLMLAPLTDGVIMVVGTETVPRRTAQHCLERLQATGARVLGAVLNRVRLANDSAYGYGYGSKAYGKYHRPAC